MKRKTTELEQRLLNDGWCLTIKRYTGKYSERTHHYEYHKTSDLRNNGKTFEQIIELDKKREKIIRFGIADVQINYLDDEQHDFIRALFFSLKHYIERLVSESKDLPHNVNVPNSELDERQGLTPMTPEEFDELCEEMEHEQ